MVFLWCFISFYGIAASSILQDCTFSANLPLDVPWLQLHCEPANVACCCHGMLNTLERPQLEAAGNARVMFSTSRTEYQGRRRDATKCGLLSFFVKLSIAFDRQLLPADRILFANYVLYLILSDLILSDLISYTLHHILLDIIFFRSYFLVGWRRSLRSPTMGGQDPRNWKGACHRQEFSCMALKAMTT